MDQRYIISGPKGSGKTTEIVKHAILLFKQNTDNIIFIVCANPQRRQYAAEVLWELSQEAYRSGNIGVISISETKLINRAKFDGAIVLIDDIEDCFEVLIVKNINSFSFNDPHQDEVRKVIDNGNV